MISQSRHQTRPGHPRQNPRDSEGFRQFEHSLFPASSGYSNVRSELGDIAGNPGFIWTISPFGNPRFPAAE